MPVASSTRKRQAAARTRSRTRWEETQAAAAARAEFAAVIANGAMVAAYPDDPGTFALDVENAEPADQLHVTLRYLGKADTFDDAAREQVHAVVAEAVKAHGPVTADIIGIAHWFIGQDGDCVVAQIQGDGLSDLRSSVAAAVEGVLGDTIADDHDSFIAHMTLGYGIDPADAEHLAGVQVVMSDVGVAFAGDVVLHGLGQAATATAEDAVAAAVDDVFADDLDEIETGFELLDDRRFRTVMVVEGVESGDGRLIAADALTWRTPPLPFMFMFRNPDGGEGHDAAVAVGHIDSVFRDEKNSRIVWGEGAFSDTKEADDAIDMIADGTIRGVSVDLDSVAVEFENPEPHPDADIEEWMDYDPGLYIIVEARIMGATGCPFPAFAEAYVELLDGDGDAEVSAVTAEAASVDATPASAAATVQARINPPSARARFADAVAPFAAPTVAELRHDAGDRVRITSGDGDPYDGEVVEVIVDESGQPSEIRVQPDGDGDPVTFPYDSPAVKNLDRSDEGAEPGDDEDGAEAALAASAGPSKTTSTLRGFAYTPFGQALVAAAGPVAPPAEWFALPADPPGGPITVTADGHIHGYVAEFGECHIGIADRCATAPRSRDQYARFRTGQVLTAEGTLIATGRIVTKTVHPDLAMAASDAAAWYHDTGAAVADVVAYDTPRGIYVTGAVRPDATPEQVRILRASDVSPDWRPINGRLEAVGMLCVNMSGFPVAQGAGLVASGGPQVPAARARFAADGECVALVAAGMVRRRGSNTRAASKSRIAALEARIEELAAWVRPERQHAATEILSKFARPDRRAAAAAILAAHARESTDTATG